MQRTIYMMGSIVRRPVVAGDDVVFGRYVIRLVDVKAEAKGRPTGDTLAGCVSPQQQTTRRPLHSKALASYVTPMCLTPPPPGLLLAPAFLSDSFLRAHRYRRKI